MAKVSAKTTDLAALLPSFQPIVRQLLAELAKDFEPVVNETYRSPERAAQLAVDPDGDGPKRATGIKDSVHCHRAAVDFRCGKHRWDCHKYGCRFYERLGEVSESLALVWGGRWPGRKCDRPHVQYITVRDQKAMRAISDWAEKDLFAAKRYARRLLLLKGKRHGNA